MYNAQFFGYEIHRFEIINGKRTIKMCNNSERQHDCRLYAQFPLLYNSGFLLCSHTGRHCPPISLSIQHTFYVSKITFFSRFRNHVSKRWMMHKRR